MKKLLFFLFFSLWTIVHAQQSVGLGLVYGQRTNFRGGAPSKGVNGIHLDYTRALFAKTDLRATAGWESTQPRVRNAAGMYVPLDNYMVIPVRVGLQQYVYKHSGIVFAESGVATGFFPYDETGTTRTRAAFSYAVGGGYQFPIREGQLLQASFSFNSNPYGKVYRFSWLALRVAYGLRWDEKV